MTCITLGVCNYMHVIGYAITLISIGVFSFMLVVTSKSKFDFNVEISISIIVSTFNKHISNDTLWNSGMQKSASVWSQYRHKASIEKHFLHKL
jgi:hypothetical protein